MTGLDVGTVSLGAALVAGLAGSGHCLAMCGGVAGALAMRGNAAGTGVGTAAAHALVYNGARVASYAIAGALAGLLGRALLAAIDVASLAVALRVVAGAVMIAAAGRLLFGWRLLDPLEAAGPALWRRVAPWARAGRAQAEALGAPSHWDSRGAGCPAG